MKWYKENSVFVWTLLIAIGVIIFGAAYSSILGEISGKFMSWVAIILDGFISSLSLLLLASAYGLHLVNMGR